VTILQERSLAGPEADAVRGVARCLTGRASALEDAAQSATGRPAGWVGAAADAAAQARERLLLDIRRAVRAHEEAAEALTACAGALDEAAALGRRAEALAWQDLAEQTAAQQARSALRAAAVVGPPLPVYVWDPHSALLVASRRFAAEAAELADIAVRRATAQLAALRPPLSAAAPNEHHGALFQIVGFGRGAWETVESFGAVANLVNLKRVATDPSGWWSDVQEFGGGVAYPVTHPREGLAAAAGLDQLKDRAYGEWLGSLVAGMAVPGGRATRLEGMAGRSVGRLVDAGGKVRIRPGLLVPPGFPVQIKDLEPHRRVHILDGDEHGGGHRAGTGNAGKSEFPMEWGDDEIIARVMQTAIRPERIVAQDTGRFQLFATHAGVEIKVVVDRGGSVVTAHPESGPGVFRNPGKGQP
jgi:hypothetical protein